MKRSPTTFKVGTRPSNLAVAQARAALNQIEFQIEPHRFEIHPLSTAGDRDRSTDLRQSPADFFTHELDAALLDGTIDCALHSAKDLPEPLSLKSTGSGFPIAKNPAMLSFCAPTKPLKISLQTPSSASAQIAAPHIPPSNSLMQSSNPSAAILKSALSNWIKVLLTSSLWPPPRSIAFNCTPVFTNVFHSNNSPFPKGKAISPSPFVKATPASKPSAHSTPPPLLSPVRGSDIATSARSPLSAHSSAAICVYTTRSWINASLIICPRMLKPLMLVNVVARTPKNNTKSHTYSASTPAGVIASSASKEVTPASSGV